MLESNAKKIRIGISTHDFMHLSGSIDFLRMIIRGLKIKKGEHELFLLIDPIPDQLKHLRTNHLISFAEQYLSVPDLLKRILHKIERSIRKGMVKLPLLSGQKSLTDIIESIGPELLTDVRILIYEGFPKGIVKTVKEFHIDIVIPTTFYLPIPFVSYLYDFQHKYFPENMQPHENELRDKYLMDLINSSASMIVTSQNTKCDLQRFYNAAIDKITVLPIVSYLEDDIFSDSLYSAIDKALISASNQKTTGLHNKPFHQINRPVLKQLKFNNGELAIQIPTPTRALVTSCFAFSLHKAGSSLLTNMLYEYFQLNDISFIDLPQIIAEIDLDIDQVENDPVNQASFESGYCFLGWRHLPPLLQHHNFTTTKNLLLVRDPRDRLVSLYFSILKSHYVPPNGNIRDALIERREETGNLTIDEFAIGFIPELIKQWNRYHQFLDWRTTKIYRYEDVIFRKTEWLIDIINYFGLPYDQKIIEKIASKNDIRPNIEQPDKHIRQVNPGNYKVHLKKETIHVINQRLDAFLQQYDYFTPDRFGTELVYAQESEEALNALKPIVQKQTVL